MDDEQLDTAIRGAGLRVTDSRRAVLRSLHAFPHATADGVYRRVLRTTPQTSLQSVYNALNDFADAGLVRRIQPAGQPGLFEVRVGDNHHHLVCRSCGRVEDVDCAEIAAPCLAPSDAHGFAVHAAEVTFWGLCPSCEASAVSHTPHS